MFVFLSKRIPIPQKCILRTLAWNSEQAWICVGGDAEQNSDQGFVKVLLLDMQASKQTGGNRLKMNQQLEGHSGSVLNAVWNEPYRKLTTSDSSGRVKVWQLFKDKWYEEMVHDRECVVAGLQWTNDGQKIIIAYEDGAAICGTVSGDRLWAKELRTTLTGTVWSDDGRRLLCATTGGEIRVFDKSGAFVSKVPLFCVDDSATAIQIIGMDWFGGPSNQIETDQRVLAIGFQNGRIQLMQHEQDENPLVLDTSMKLTCLKWSCQGNILATCGSQEENNKVFNFVKFFSPSGHYLRSMRVQGNAINAVSWEGSGLHLALAVDSNIFFATIRPDYPWCFFGNTLVYSFTKPTRPEQCVILWNIATDTKHVKYVRQLKMLTASSTTSRCLLVTKAEETPTSHIFILCNAIGSPVDSKFVDFVPKKIHLTDTHVVSVSDYLVYVWNYAPASSTEYAEGVQFEQKEVEFQVDDHLSIGSGPRKSTSDAIVRRAKRHGDPICAVTASNRTLLVARESGLVLRYSFPNLVLEDKFQLAVQPQLLAINCNTTRICCIDMLGIATLWDISVVGSTERVAEFERKDSWAVKWADDDPELFAIMEKTRMYVFRGMQPEEPVGCDGYVCKFTDLKITAVLLDTIMKEPDKPNKDHVLDFETKPLRDTRDLSLHVSVAEAFAFVESRPHPQLWRIVAETALEQLDLSVAEKAFVRKQDYGGIQFVKRLHQLSDKVKVKAEICAYFRRFDEAEQLYQSIDRLDLALELRSRIGDWFRVVALLHQGGGAAGSDAMLRKAYAEIGDYYADRMKWSQAVEYYKKARNCNEKLAQAYYVVEDYESLYRLGESLPDGHPLLADIGDKIASVGMSELAVNIFIKGQDVKKAINTCVTLNQWDRAVKLAEQHKFRQIEALLSKYAAHLLESGNILQAIELYRKASHHTEATKLLLKLASEDFASKVRPLRAKKLAVLAALEIEEYRRKTQDVVGAGGYDGAAATLDALLDDTPSKSAAGQSVEKAFDNPWRAAEAYHFFILAQRQLYEQNFVQAVTTASRLREYEDIIDKKEAHSLIALAAYLSGFYGICSRSFICLEALDSATHAEQEGYEKLALDIFKAHSPNDPKQTPVAQCTSCNTALCQTNIACPTCMSAIPVCVATGASIFPGDSQYFVCRTCNHRSLDSSIRQLNYCPLCHIHI